MTLSKTLFSTLQVLADPTPRGAAFNMALDEALLERMGDSGLGNSTPALRVYRWVRPAVSCGIFSRVAAARAGFPGHEPVRRCTGGGIVEHGDGLDWTYSLLVPGALSFARSPAAASYRGVHQALAAALGAWGQAGVVLAAAGATDGSGVADAASGQCFAQTVPADLLLAGRKVAGGAQRRTRAGLLYQGSVGGLAATADAAGRDALAQAFAAALAGQGNARWHHGPVENFPPFAAAKAGAEELVRLRYGTRAWLEKR